jgi:hypothetical protein
MVTMVASRVLVTNRSEEEAATYSEWMIFPTRGRIERRVAWRHQAGLCFTGTRCSRWCGPICQFLMYERPTNAAYSPSLGTLADSMVGSGQPRSTGALPA